MSFPNPTPVSSPHAASKVFVVGGTGAQGMSVVRGLVSDGKYSARVLSRDVTSERAKELVGLGDVEVVEGTFADEEVLRRGFHDCAGAFVNIDGFNTGEKAETYWAMRSYEIAIEEGIEFFVYGNLDYVAKLTGYDSTFRTGHYDGKGRVGDWILAENHGNRGRMGAALFTTGPYIEMTLSPLTPMTPSLEDGVLTWRVPLGDGAVPHVALDDCGFYVRWLFDHPDRAVGMNLAVAIEQVRYAELAAAFERVTGHPARYVDTDLDTYWQISALAPRADKPAGYNADASDKSTMTVRQNFTGFWNNWRHETVTRDYALLDEIHPHRIRTAEEWFRREDERGKAAGLGGLAQRFQPENAANLIPVLKTARDGRRGRL